MWWLSQMQHNGPAHFDKVRLRCLRLGQIAAEVRELRICAGVASARLALVETRVPRKAEEGRRRVARPFPRAFELHAPTAERTVPTGRLKCLANPGFVDVYGDSDPRGARVRIAH